MHQWPEPTASARETAQFGEDTAAAVSSLRYSAFVANRKMRATIKKERDMSVAGEGKRLDDVPISCWPPAFCFIMRLNLSARWTGAACVEAVRPAHLDHRSGSVLSRFFARTPELAAF